MLRCGETTLLFFQYFVQIINLTVFQVMLGNGISSFQQF